MAERPRVTVLGSLNTDISLPVPHLPGPGETVLAGAAATVGTGGKGANQAVAAARLGAATRMVGCCGDDEFGGRLRAALVAEGIDVAGLRAVPGAASGLALITVDPAGENSIAVAPGANALAGEPELAAVFAAPCDVLVLSAEIPAALLEAALHRARERDVLTVLNLAPVPAGAGRLLAGRPAWLVVNTQEAGVLLGEQEPDAASARSMAARLAAGTPCVSDPGRKAPGHPGPEPGPGCVVITLGGAGAALAGAAGTTAVPGFGVDAIDTVGAGDAFVGALAVALATGLDPAGAVRAACAAGAAATTRRGAQDGLPRPPDVQAATGFAWPEPGTSS